MLTNCTAAHSAIHGVLHNVNMLLHHTDNVVTNVTAAYTYYAGFAHQLAQSCGGIN